MFHGSDQQQEERRKRVLEPAKLVAWWLALIDSTFSNHSSVEAFVHTPSEALAMPAFAHALKACVAQSPLAKSKVHWICGYPYPKEGAIDQHIPLFEDDPKWRHYEAAAAHVNSAKRMRRDSDSHQNIGEFFQSLGVRHEFRQDPSALIVIALSKTREHNVPVIFPKKTLVTDFIKKLLMTLDFSSDAEALRSSMRLWSWNQITAGKAPFEVKAVGENYYDRSMDDHFYAVMPGISFFLSSFPCEHQQSLEQRSTTDVQSLIRRKVPNSFTII